MAYTFYLSAFFVSLYVIYLRSRRVDIFSIACVFCYVYTYPIFLGVAYDPSIMDFINIVDPVYYVYGIFLFSMSFFGYLSEKRKFRYDLFSDESLHLRFKIDYQILFFICSGILLVFFILNPSFLLPSSGTKVDVSQFGVLFPIYIWFSLSLVTAGAFSNSRVMKVATFPFILVFLIAGIRSYFVVGVIIIVWIKLWKLGKVRLSTSFRYVLVGVIAFFLLIIYKVALNPLREGDFSQAITLILDVTLILYRLNEGGESSLIMANLVNSYNYTDTYSSNDYSGSAVFKLLPFGAEAFSQAFGYNAERFSFFMSKLFYSNVSYGMGASLFGELAFIGGKHFSYFVSFSLGAIAYFFERFIRNVKSNHVLFFLPVVVYVFFYFHRIEISFVSYIIGINTLMFFIFRFVKFSIRSR